MRAVEELPIVTAKDNTGGKYMDNFLGAVVFLLPGVLAYFWLQAFGVNPVAKHSPTEFTAVAGLLWLPVSFGTLILYNFGIWLSSFISQAKPIWTLPVLKDASNSFTFLIVFLLLSVFVSFIFSFIWAMWGFKVQQLLVNWVRVKRGFAKFSDTISVWDEVFGKDESQLVEIGRLDKPDNITVTGEIKKASRTFEPERLCLADVTFMTELVKEYSIPVDNIFVDTKSGLYIKVYNSKAVKEAIPKKEAITTSSEQEVQA